jgi:hypothetical protein
LIDICLVVDEEMIMNIFKLFVISPIVFALLAGCTSNISKSALPTHENPLDSSCGARSLSAYSKLTDETGNPYKISDIYSVLDREAGEQSPSKQNLWPYFSVQSAQSAVKK